MSLIIVINFLFYFLTYKFSVFFSYKVMLLIKKRKKASSIASITLFKDYYYISSSVRKGPKV